MTKNEENTSFNSKPDYFYEKKYRRFDGTTYVKRYSRSFPLSKINNQEKHTLLPTNTKEASLSRARSTIRLIAFSNPQLAGFLTLTFAGTPTEEEAHEKLKLYFKRVRLEYPQKFQFLGVPELQKRGVLHFHFLVNFCPAMSPSPNNPRKRISSLWTFGFSDYQVIKGDQKWRTELYLLKYITKEKTRLLSQYYIRSRNLNKIEPVYFPTREPIHPLAENLWISVSKPKNTFDNFIVWEYDYSVKATNKDRKNIYHVPTHLRT